MGSNYSIKAEKVHAMNNYKNHKKSQFLSNLILYSLTTLIFTSFICYPFWFSPLWSSINHFLFVSLPNFKSFFFNPKCLFIVGNVIIAFLVGEWKFSGSYSSPVSDIYDEYVERSRSLRGISMTKGKKEDGKIEKIKSVEESKTWVEKDLHVEEKGKGKEKGGEKNRDDGKNEEEGQGGLPIEELNKRVEDFITRVNRQRWLEAKLQVFERG